MLYFYESREWKLSMRQRLFKILFRIKMQEWIFELEGKGDRKK